MKDLIKKKIASAVTHVKAHPAIYGYLAGGVVGVTATYLAINYELGKLPVVNIESLADEIVESGKQGMILGITGKGTLIAFLNERLENPIDLNI